jgi:hypothetical protein
MKLPSLLSLTYVGLLLLTLVNRAYNIPIFADYSLYGSNSVENAGMILSDCIEKEDCLKIDIIDDNKVGDIISDFGTKNNCTSNTSIDTNTMCNVVPVLSQSTDKNQTHNITFYKTSTTTDKNYQFDKFVEFVMNDFVPSDTSSDVTDNLTFAKRDDNVGFTIVDDILYKDMPGILIISIADDDGEAHNIEVENAVQVTGDEITLNFNKAVQALADFINKEDMSLEDSMEWNEDSEPEEPQRIVENGYIFYDMGESIYLSYLQIFYLTGL